MKSNIYKKRVISINNLPSFTHLLMLTDLFLPKDNLIVRLSVIKTQDKIHS